jgi:hypothetical protein
LTSTFVVFIIAKNFSVSRSNNVFTINGEGLTFNIFTNKF